jgi:hypothetical protein
MRKSKLAALCLGLALTGCATGGVRVETQGPGPDFKAAPTFALDLGSIEGSAPPDPALAAAVTNRLRSHGMVEASAGAQVLVEVAYTDRPMRVGDYLGAQSDRPQWLTTPRSPGLWASPHERLCSLAVRMSVPATGAELYRVRAAVRPPRQGCGAAVQRLADAALSQIPLPPRR